MNTIKVLFSAVAIFIAMAMGGCAMYPVSGDHGAYINGVFVRGHHDQYGNFIADEPRVIVQPAYVGPGYSECINSGRPDFDCRGYYGYGQTNRVVTERWNLNWTPGGFRTKTTTTVVQQVPGPTVVQRETVYVQKERMHHTGAQSNVHQPGQHRSHTHQSPVNTGGKVWKR